jgi:riboflavin synthase
VFTGYIESVGSIKSLQGPRLIIDAPDIADEVSIGASIAVNGVCLTVTRIERSMLEFHLSPTTVSHSRFKPGVVRSGELVNLERAMSASSRFDGHMVAGHIDNIARISTIRKSGEDTFFELIPPVELHPMIVPKGSVAIDGISLTVSAVSSRSFEVTVIPHTIAHTNLQQKRTGDHMHIEVDMIARTLYHFTKRGDVYGR